MTNKAQVNHYADALVRLTAYQNPKTGFFIPIIDFIGRLDEETIVNSYQANAVFEEWEEAIVFGINIAELMNYSVVQFEDMEQTDFEIMVWDPRKNEHRREVKTLHSLVKEIAKLEDFENDEFEFDNPNNDFIHTTTKVRH